MMEEKIFRRPAVAELLRGFIEARLHYDTGPSPKQNVERERKLVGSIGTPTYVIVDPVTGATIKIQEGPSGAETFIEFLRTKALE
jgi:hypothetical protein